MYEPAAPAPIPLHTTPHAMCGYTTITPLLLLLLLRCCSCCIEFPETCWQCCVPLLPTLQQGLGGGCGGEVVTRCVTSTTQSHARAPLLLSPGVGEWGRFPSSANPHSPSCTKGPASSCPNPPMDVNCCAPLLPPLGLGGRGWVVTDASPAPHALLGTSTPCAEPCRELPPSVQHHSELGQNRPVFSCTQRPHLQLSPPPLILLRTPPAETGPGDW
jgi:hypothetical protein